MTTLLLLLAALAAGYAGGRLACGMAREQEMDRIRRSVQDLLQELAAAAESSCEQVLAERHKLEEMVASVQNQTAVVNIAQPEKTKADPKAEIRNRVMLLAQRGKTSAQIAQQLDLGQGEVDLMLNLIRLQNSWQDLNAFEQNSD